MRPESHPDELIGRYPDLVDDRERAAVDRHLRDCPRCRALVAQLEVVQQAAADLARPPLAVETSADLAARARARMHEAAGAPGAPTEAVRRRWIRRAAIPLAVAAALALALLLRPDEGVDPGPRDPDTDFGFKGDDPHPDLSELELQLVLVAGEASVALAPGDEVPGGSRLLVGAVIAPDVPACVVVVRGEGRQSVWTGIGDLSTAAGGALFDGAVPATAWAPDEGPFSLELWHGLDPDAPDARRLHEFPLRATPRSRR